MAWIESHQSLGAHRKTKALKRLLKIKTPQAIGHLHMLWWWCLDNAPDGSLLNIDDADLADAAEWSGDATKFVQALTVAGFIDEDTRALHNWWDYAGKLIERRSLTREQRQLGGKKRMEQLSAEERSQLAHKAISARWDTSRNTSKAGIERVPSKKEIPAKIPGAPSIDTSYRTNRTVPTPPREDTTTPQPPPPLSLLSEKQVEEVIVKSPYTVFVEEGFEKRLTHFNSEQITDACEHYTDEWVVDAMREAVKQGKKTWAYVEGILKNWALNGRDVDMRPQKPGDKTDPDRFVKGKYGETVKQSMDRVSAKFKTFDTIESIQEELKKRGANHG